MKRIISFILLLLVFFQTSLFSVTYIDERVNDVYFANGVLNDKDSAEKSLKEIIKATLKEVYNNNDKAMLLETDFKLAYNQSAHVLDFIEVIDQKLDEHWMVWVALEILKNFASSGGLGSADVAFEVIAHIVGDILGDEFNASYVEHILNLMFDVATRNYIEVFLDSVNIASGVVSEYDMSIQRKDITESIKNGHNVIVVAHSQGNFFLNEVYERVVYDAPWMGQYINAVSVASPANSAIKSYTPVYIFDNDPLEYVPDQADQEYKIKNPLRMIEVVADCELKSGIYLSSEINLTSVGQCTQMQYFDIPTSTFHAFSYYMSKTLTSSTGATASNPAYKLIMKNIGDYITGYRTYPSQWKLKKGKRCVLSCNETLREVEHRYDDSMNELMKDEMVYPFSDSGKLYTTSYVGNEYTGMDYIHWYVMATELEGEGLVFSSNEKVCYELRTMNNSSVGRLLDSIEKQSEELIPNPKNGYVEVSLHWENKDFDMDLQVSFPGEHDIKDKCEPFEHFYSPSSNYKKVGEGLYPIYVRYTYDGEDNITEAMKQMQNIIVSIKIPAYRGTGAKSEARKGQRGKDRDSA